MPTIQPDSYSARGHVLGGAFVGRVAGRLAGRVGVPETATVDVGPAKVAVVLQDGRFPFVLHEAAGAGGVGATISRVLGPGDTYVDVGANGGGYVAYATSVVGPSGRVVAVEPQPRLAEAVRTTLRANGVPGSVHEVAASERDGRLRLHLSRSSGEASLDGEGPGVDVNVRRLDDVLPRDLPGRVLLKIDVEGHELSVLKGAESTLSRHAPTIVFEFSPDALRRAGTEPIALLEWLEARGYRFHSTGDLENGPVTARSCAADPRQRDLVATPARTCQGGSPADSGHVVR